MKRVKYNEKLFKIIDDCGFKSSNNEVTFNDIKIDFTGYSLEDIPFKYQKIEIVEIENNQEDVIFTGYLDTIQVSMISKKFRELTLTLLSPLKMATVRTVSLIGTYTHEEAIRRVLQPLIDDGFTLEELNIDDGEITTNFVLETIENAMNNICSKANVFWFINEKRGIYVNSINSLFGKGVVKRVTEDEYFRGIGLLSVNPTIENIDYSNIINFKNVRLIYSSNSDDNTDTQDKYPIMQFNKKIKKGDTVNFDNPIIVDEEHLRNHIKEENEETTGFTYYSFFINLHFDDEATSFFHIYKISISTNQNDENYNKYVKDDRITFSDDAGEEGDIVLQRDDFYKNLITGFKWNVDKEVTIISIASDTALRYTTMKFMYSTEINKLKGIISDSGQIERTIDYNEKWTTLQELISYARSLMTQNSNVVNSVQLEYEINPNLKVGDIVDIQLPSFYAEGNFAVKEIDYNYINKIQQRWTITLKSADLISTYIDMFRPAEKEESEDTINTVILSEFVEEQVNEIHSIDINNSAHTLNFNL